MNAYNAMKIVNQDNVQNHEIKEFAILVKMILISSFFKMKIVLKVHAYQKYMYIKH